MLLRRGSGRPSTASRGRTRWSPAACASSSMVMTSSCRAANSIASGTPPMLRQMRSLCPHCWGERKLVVNHARVHLEEYGRLDSSGARARQRWPLVVPRVEVPRCIAHHSFRERPSTSS